MTERITLPIYENLLTGILRDLAVESGTVTSPVEAGTNVLSDNTKRWSENIHRNRLVKIISGTGAGQVAVVNNNSASSLVIRGSWTLPLDTTSKYVIISADLAQVFRDVFGGGSDISSTNPLQVYDPKAYSLRGLCFYGKVTAIPGANQFTIPELAGMGAGIFSDPVAPYRAFVLRDAGGLGDEPQGAMRIITDYDTATGTFTTEPFTFGAFSFPVDVGDEILIIHPRLAEIADLYGDARDINLVAGSFDFDLTSAAEQIGFTLTPSDRIKINSIWLDMVNVTRNTTIRFKYKIDGTNYRTFTTLTWLNTDDPGVLIGPFAAYGDVQVTFQCDGGGVGSATVHYEVL